MNIALLQSSFNFTRKHGFSAMPEQIYDGPKPGHVIVVALIGAILGIVTGLYLIGIL